MEKGQGKRIDTLQTDKVFTRKEYIERETALAFMNEVEPCICHNPDGVVFTATKDSDMLDYLRSIPAADVVPVRHGYWNDGNGPVLLDKDGCPTHGCYCSVCGDWLVASDEYPVKGNYCPNCGARMDGDGE